MIIIVAPNYFWMAFIVCVCCVGRVTSGGVRHGDKVYRALAAEFGRRCRERLAC